MMQDAVAVDPFFEMYEEDRARRQKSRCLCVAAWTLGLGGCMAGLLVLALHGQN